MADNRLCSLSDYSRFVTELLDRPSVQRSTVTIWSASRYTGIAEGEVFFTNGIRLRMREELDSILMEHTNQPFDKIRRDTDRDFFMNGQQAKEYGVIDEVIVKAAHVRESEAKTTGKGGKR